MDDPFLGRVLYRLADLDKKFQPLGNGQPVPIGNSRDRNAIDILHDEERSAFIAFSRIENTGDVRVIHHGKRLPLVSGNGRSPHASPFLA